MAGAGRGWRGIRYGWHKKVVWCVNVQLVGEGILTGDTPTVSYVGFARQGVVE